MRISDWSSDVCSSDLPIVDAMGKMSFTSRDLVRATSIYNQMLADKDCSIFLVIAGSTSAGGCMDLYAELLRSNMIDGGVANGASIVAMDFFEGRGHKQHQTLEIPDDTRSEKRRVGKSGGSKFK